MAATVLQVDARAPIKANDPGRRKATRYQVLMSSGSGTVSLTISHRRK